MEAEVVTSATSAAFDAATTASQLPSSANLTQYAPSANDLLLLAPRIAVKITKGVAKAFGYGGSNIDEAVAGTANAAPVLDTANMAANAATEGAPQASGSLTSKISLESGRSFANMMAYATSRWSLGCFIMAIVVNRTQVYAATRRPLALGFRFRFAIRIIPIVLLAVQARWLLQSIQCQTSPDFAMMRWGDSTKAVDQFFVQDGGPLHTLSQSLLFGASDQQSCLAVRMVPVPIQADDEATPQPKRHNLRGSLSRLWPLFKTLCTSQFVETLSAAIQGKHVASETGMTLFEHSLAFAEAEAAVSATFKLGPFGSSPVVTTQSSSKSKGDKTEAKEAINRSMIMQRLNTSPAVLLIAFLSCMSHITSHILGIFNLQNRLRLVSTAFWGICFMTTLAWSIYEFSGEDSSSQSLLRFPTVCIIGFIPHVMIFAGILICGGIYAVAVLLVALAPPRGLREQHNTFRERLWAAHENMQASIPLSSIRVNMQMDFYSALLKTGFSTLTMASEAVFLNENMEIKQPARTWIEDQRLQQLEEEGAQWLGPGFRQTSQNSLGLVMSENDMGQKNGYLRELATPKDTKQKSDNAIRDGVGATERSGRWVLAVDFIYGILKLILSWAAVLLLKILGGMGIQWRPRWLTRVLKQRSTQHVAVAVDGQNGEPQEEDFWLVNQDGNPVSARLTGDSVDIEKEVRARISNGVSRWGKTEEQQLDRTLYSWWLGNGWWGTEDSSGLYTPLQEPEKDDDLTSMISDTDAASVASSQWNSAWESEGELDDGQRTPTQSAMTTFARERTPAIDMPLAGNDLARLLNPQSPEDRAEAQALAAHLSSDQIMTRSRYRQLYEKQRTRVLTSTRERPAHLQSKENLTPEEEAQLLEHLIITRRAQAGQNRRAQQPDEDDAPHTRPCAVCQVEPRKIITWPCKCLALCDDCRVNLAMNNYSKCITCRRDVRSYSRVYDP
jgi:hypothetical protein